MKNLTKILVFTLVMLTVLLSTAACSFADQSEEFYIDGPASITMQVGETVTLELVKPDNLKGKVEWTSDDNIVLVEDGVVVAAAEGITVVRATLGKYTDKVIVTVGTPKPGTGGNNTGSNTGNNNTGNNNTGNNGGNTDSGNNGGSTGDNTGNTGGNTGSGTTASLIGSIDFSSTAQRASQDANSQVWQNGNVTFTNDKASSANDVANYSNPVRLYPASTVTIECQGMTKIVFTCGEYTGKDYPAALQGATFDSGATVTVDGLVVTVTLSAPVNTFNITINTQVRLMSLEVYGN